MKPKILFSIVFLFAFLLVVTGCSSTVNGEEVLNETDQGNITSEQIVETPSSCTAQWKCISTSVRRFQESNCTFKAQEKCPISCDFETGDCKKIQCEEGYFCEDPNTRGFRDKFCSWMLEEKCEFGCKDAVCLNQTQFEEEKNKTEAAKAAVAEVYDPYAGVSWLNYGESAEVAVGNITYDLSIRLIEAGKIKVQVGGFTSDWLSEGDTANFYGGTVSFTLVEINFQAYEGGLQRVGYKLSTS